MIVPAQKEEALLADIRRAREQPGQFHLWWLGQSGFLVQWRGRHLLFDPYLSDTLTAKYATTDKPHVRMTERVVDPATVQDVDVVTSSHNHTDHLDAATLLALTQANPTLKLVIAEANRAFVCSRLGWSQDIPLGLDAGQSLRLGDFKIHAVPAAHNDLEKDAAGRHLFLGYVLEVGPWVVYHAGDTLLYPGMVDELRRWPVDVALLPMNGHRPERRVAGNLNGVEAATLAQAIGAGLAIPCHYEMFEFNTASPEDFCRTAARLGQAVRVLRAGERWSSPPRD